MRIRELNQSDLDDLIGLYAHYTEPENLPPLSAERIVEIWAAVRANPGVRYFGLETEDRLAAACILTITPSFIRGGFGYGVLEHVVTHTDFRRRGLARKLMEHVLDHAWAEGCTEVMLLSGADLAPAHKLYEGLGFDGTERVGFIRHRPGGASRP